MKATIEILKWIGWKKVLWSLACFVAIILVGANTKDEKLVTGIFWIGVAGWGFWFLKKVAEFFTPERKKAIGTGIKHFLILSFLVVFFGTIVAAYTSASTPTPTQANPWQDAMLTVGLDKNTPKPAKAQLTALICPRFPKSSKTEEFCGKAINDIWNNDIKAFRQEFALATNQASAEELKKSKDTIVIHPWAIELVVLLTVLFAVIGAFLGKSIDYVGKITGTALWALLAAAIYAGVVALSPTDELVIAFSIGAGIRFFAVVLTVLGLEFSLFREDVKVQGKGKSFIVKVIFTCIGSLIGLGIDGLLQTPILTNLVINGQGLSLNDAYVSYQLGTLFAGGFTSIISTGLLFAQSYVATPKKDRKP